jgi:hypothetical protein
MCHVSVSRYHKPPAAVRGGVGGAREPVNGISDSHPNSAMKGNARAGFARDNGFLPYCVGRCNDGKCARPRCRLQSESCGEWLQIIDPVSGCFPPAQGIPGEASIEFRLGGIIMEPWPATLAKAPRRVKVRSMVSSIVCGFSTQGNNQFVRGKKNHFHEVQQNFVPTNPMPCSKGCSSSP